MRDKPRDGEQRECNAEAGRNEREREGERGHRERARGKEGGAGGEREREKETVDRETILTVEGEVNVHRDPELAQASRKSRRKPSLESCEFSAPLSLSPSLARSLVPSISLSFSLVRDLPLFLPFPLSFPVHAVLACFIFLSFLFASVPVVVLSVGYSIGRSVRASGPRPRAVASAKDLTRANERVCASERANERSRGHRARPPFTTVSFVFSLFLPLDLSLSLSLSLASLFLSLRIRRTPGAHSVVKNPAAARRSYTQLPLL